MGKGTQHVSFCRNTCHLKFKCPLINRSFRVSEQSWKRLNAFLSSKTIEMLDRRFSYLILLIESLRLCFALFLGDFLMNFVWSVK